MSNWLENSQLFRGGAVQASYREQIIPVYRNIPIIETLPDILTKDQFIKLATYLPEYEPSLRELPPEYRLHLVLDASRCGIVLPTHIDLEQRFSRIIRMGYVNRNPLTFGYWKEVDAKTALVDAKNSNAHHQGSRMLGFNIIGISGGGKSTGIEMVLSLTPQLIEHGEYKGKNFTWRQIVWLKLDCPMDGSIKGLCLNFFRAVDDLLGTNYYHFCARDGRATVDEMIPSIARLAFVHSIGLMVIDEIQNLSHAKSGGAAKMLSFFVQLVNTTGMPIVLVGTPKAKSVLASEFRQARRGAGQGDMIWHPMKKDASWEFFLSRIWGYQYVKNITPLNDEMSETIYEESAGIPDIAVKLYILAQVRAITTGREEITSGIIRSVAKDSLSTLQPMLNALRKNDKKALLNFPDIEPIDIEFFLKKYTQQEDTITVRTTPNKSLKAENKAIPQKKNSRTDAIYAANSLPNLIADGRKQDLTPYEALKNMGCICHAEEYLEIHS